MGFPRQEYWNGFPFHPPEDLSHPVIKPRSPGLQAVSFFAGGFFIDWATSSVPFCRSVMSGTLWPHGLQQAKLPCPPLTSRVCSNSCPSSRWCHPTISSCCPLLLLPSVFPSIRVFSNESVLRIMWPAYLSFRFSISPSNEYSGLISFRVDWLDLLAVQGTLKSLLQHHSSKASILQCSAFFRSNSYIHTGLLKKL